MQVYLKTVWEEQALMHRNLIKIWRFSRNGPSRRGHGDHRVQKCSLKISKTTIISLTLIKKEDKETKSQKTGHPSINPLKVKFFKTLKRALFPISNSK